MKKYLLFFPVLFFAVLLLIPRSDVSALQVATATPTRDITIPPFTPTPGGRGDGFLPTSVPGDFSCPAGMPAGYGIVTPDSLWSMACGACLPSATPWEPLYPTPAVISTPCDFSWGPVEDPACYGVLSSPSPSPFPTSPVVVPATPYVVNSLTCGSSGAGTCLQVSTSEIKYTGNGVWIRNGLSFPFTLQNAGVVYGRVSAVGVPSSGTIQYEHQASGFVGSLIGYYKNPNVENYAFTFPTSFVVDWGERMDEGVNTGIYTFAFSSTSGGSQFVVYSPDSWNYLKDYALFNNDTIEFSSVPFGFVPPVITPTATTTPVGGGYCDSIGGGGTSALVNQTMSFWGEAAAPICLIVPSFNTGQILDFLNWVGFVIPLGVQEMIILAVAYFSVVTPAMTICFQSYEILAVNFFGLQISLSIFGTIYIGVYIINHFTNR